MGAALRVIDSGAHTSVQDFGRIGHQRLGVPVSGALDWPSLALANAVVGNPAGTAGLECLFAGPTLEVAEGAVRIALGGTAAALTIHPPEDNAAPYELPAGQSARLAAGARFRLAAIRDSRVAYIAIEGGLDLPPALGSLSTYSRAAMGGFQGRALRRDDLIPLARPEADQRPERRSPVAPPPPLRQARVVLGPQEDYFSAEGLATFLGAEYAVAAESDRMGMRLDGPAIEHAADKGFNIASDGIAAGAIQVPGSGQPIILLADRQTTGGYPKIATVASADLPGLGRLRPGEKLRFQAIGVEEAEAARRALNASVQAFSSTLEETGLAAGPAQFRYDGQNLISGVVDAHAPAAGTNE